MGTKNGGSKTQKAMIDTIQETKEFGIVRHAKMHTKICVTILPIAYQPTVASVSRHHNGHHHIVFIPKANGTGWLCLDPARLNQVIIRPVN